MGRKKNPFAFSEGNLRRVDKGIQKDAAGYYPSQRSYGSQISPTATERLNYDSRWSRWRKGYELYSQGAFWDYGRTTVEILAGTQDATTVNLRLYGFPPSSRDRADQLHYVLYREPTSYETLGILAEVQDLDDGRTALIVTEASSQLRRLVGDRITDGACSATIVDVQTNSGIPLLVMGMLASPELAIEVRIPPSQALTDYLAAVGGPANLVGRSLAGQPNLFSTPLVDPALVGDNSQFQLELASALLENRRVAIADSNQTLTEFVGSLAFSGVFSYDGNQLATVLANGVSLDQLAAQTTGIDISVPTLTIATSVLDGDVLVLTTNTNSASGDLRVAFTSATIFVDPESTSVTNADGTVTQLFCRFTPGVTLKATPLFCCSCPDHSKVRFRSPSSVNRQDRYPLPSFAARGRFDTFDDTAGLFSTWRKSDYSPRVGYCKHIYAAQFIVGIKPAEPGDYPPNDGVIQLEKQIKVEMKAIAARMMNPFWGRDYARLELIYVLAQGVGFDAVEFASILPVNQTGVGTGAVQLSGNTVLFHNGSSFVDLFTGS
ncbi:hypothetical protein [Synechococcus elongatus]|uniref:hypothetical protein n=1 Tax=Synechococcus elongatus TaxID=32046 RepID=UPI000F7DF259|nr:hypothetical protein [Synechococcus elongatus]